MVDIQGLYNNHKFKLCDKFNETIIIYSGLSPMRQRKKVLVKLKKNKQYYMKKEKWMMD